jgi:arabinose-5-phosphate isomerase
MGMVIVMDPGRPPAGIFTDGDLRRALARSGDIRTATLGELMSRSPRHIGPDALAAEAAQLMEAHRISQLLVLDADGQLVGALNMHDLMQAKVI